MSLYDTATLLSDEFLYEFEKHAVRGVEKTACLEKGILGHGRRRRASYKVDGSRNYLKFHGPSVNAFNHTFIPASAEIVAKYQPNGMSPGRFTWDSSSSQLAAIRHAVRLPEFHRASVMVRQKDAYRLMIVMAGVLKADGMYFHQRDENHVDVYLLQDRRLPEVRMYTPGNVLQFTDRSYRQLITKFAVNPRHVMLEYFDTVHELHKEKQVDDDGHVTGLRVADQAGASIAYRFDGNGALIGVAFDGIEPLNDDYDQESDLNADHESDDAGDSVWSIDDAYDIDDHVDDDDDDGDPGPAPSPLALPMAPAAAGSNLALRPETSVQEEIAEVAPLIPPFDSDLDPIQKRTVRPTLDDLRQNAVLPPSSTPASGTNRYRNETEPGAGHTPDQLEKRRYSEDSDAGGSGGGEWQQRPTQESKPSSGLLNSLKSLWGSSPMKPEQQATTPSSMIKRPNRDHVQDASAPPSSSSYNKPSTNHDRSDIANDDDEDRASSRRPVSDPRTDRSQAPPRLNGDRDDRSLPLATVSDSNPDHYRDDDGGDWSPSSTHSDRRRPNNDSNDRHPDHQREDRPASRDRHRPASDTIHDRLGADDDMAPADHADKPQRHHTNTQAVPVERSQPWWGRLFGSQPSSSSSPDTSISADHIPIGDKNRNDTPYDDDQEPEQQPAVDRQQAPIQGPADRDTHPSSAMHQTMPPAPTMDRRRPESEAARPISQWPPSDSRSSPRPDDHRRQYDNNDVVPYSVTDRTAPIPGSSSSSSSDYPKTSWATTPGWDYPRSGPSSSSSSSSATRPDNDSSVQWPRPESEASSGWPDLQSNTPAAVPDHESKSDKVVNPSSHGGWDYPTDTSLQSQIPIQESKHSDSGTGGHWPSLNSNKDDISIWDNNAAARRSLQKRSSLPRSNLSNIDERRPSDFSADSLPSRQQQETDSRPDRGSHAASRHPEHHHNWPDRTGLRHADSRTPRSSADGNRSRSAADTDPIDKVANRPKATTPFWNRLFGSDPSSSQHPISPETDHHQASSARTPPNSSPSDERMPMGSNRSPDHSPRIDPTDRSDPSSDSGRSQPTSSSPATAPWWNPQQQEQQQQQYQEQEPDTSSNKASPYRYGRQPESNGDSPSQSFQDPHMNGDRSRALHPEWLSRNKNIEGHSNAERNHDDGGEYGHPEERRYQPNDQRHPYDQERRDAPRSDRSLHDPDESSWADQDPRVQQPNNATWPSFNERRPLEQQKPDPADTATNKKSDFYRPQTDRDAGQSDYAPDNELRNKKSSPQVESKPQTLFDAVDVSSSPEPMLDDAQPDSSLDDGARKDSINGTDAQLRKRPRNRASLASMFLDSMERAEQDAKERPFVEDKRKDRSVQSDWMNESPDETKRRERAAQADEASERPQSLKETKERERPSDTDLFSHEESDPLQADANNHDNDDNRASSPQPGMMDKLAVCMSWLCGYPMSK